MKKILIIALLIPVCNFSQYSKKELKTIDKMELRISNRGLDLKASFIPFHSSFEEYGTESEENWSMSLFEAGLEVGSYYNESTVKDTENREMEVSRANIFNGRYVFDVSTYKQIKIRDLESDNKIVCTISYKGDVNYSLTMSNFRRKYILEKLIKSN